jgi:hypothetical protein
VLLVKAKDWSSSLFPQSLGKSMLFQHSDSNRCNSIQYQYQGYRIVFYDISETPHSNHRGELCVAMRIIFEIFHSLQVKQTDVLEMHACEVQIPKFNISFQTMNICLFGN